MINISIKTEQLILFRSIDSESIIQKFKNLLSILDKGNNKDAPGLYYELFSNIISLMPGRFKYNIYKAYIAYLILINENPFSITAERDIQANENIKGLIEHDFNILLTLFNIDLKNIEHRSSIVNGVKISNFYGYTDLKVNDRLVSAIDDICSLLSSHDCATEDFIKEIYRLYSKYGCGQMAIFDAFLWEDGLKGINTSSYPQLSEIIGYNRQKQSVIDNTNAFLKKEGFNNLLLFGDRGTGKSTIIRSLIREFNDEKLKIIELSKDSLIDIPKLFDMFGKRGFKLILFIDDLSFEDDSQSFNTFKSLIEGSLMQKPDNIVIYATSNRRHLVRESFSDDEVHVNDTVQEKLSLADRFGIMVRFVAPDKVAFLDIVNQLAKREGINITENLLMAEAEQWQMSYNGRSGRSARQFVDYLKNSEEELI